jgi:hypothetical protein
LVRPAKYTYGGICNRCSKGRPPLPLEGFDPTTALPPIHCANPVRAITERKLAEKAAAVAEKAAAKLVKQAAKPVPEPPPAMPPFVPFAGRPPADLPDWTGQYLVALSELGREYVAANKAGVPAHDVRALAKLRKDFRSECRVAHGFYSDMLEIKLALSTQVPGPIVVMKRRRPKRFLEPALIQQNVITNTILVPPLAEALMRDFDASLDERRVRMLRGEVIDVPADVIVESGAGVEVSA